VSWLLDTCVLSEYVKKVPASRVIQWLDAQDEDSLFVSVVSVGEIEKGILKLAVTDIVRSRKLAAWLGKLEQRFSGRLLSLDAGTLRVWAQLAAGAELTGQTLPVMDGLIMATAQCRGLTIVTRNTFDFRFYPQVFDPWTL
jgi:predicted nucleic acid-binding protein